MSSQSQGAESADAIIDQLLTSESDEQSLSLVSAFHYLPFSEKVSAEERLVELLNDTAADKVPRSWITTMLGQMGTPGARKALIARLRDDGEADFVKRWAGKNLRRFFDGDETAALLAERVAKETSVFDQQRYAGELAESRSKVAFRELVPLLEHDHSWIRFHAARGIQGSPQKSEALQLLLERVDKEKKDSVRVVILDTLGSIGDPKAAPALTAQVIAQVREPAKNSYDIKVTAVQSLVKTATEDDEEAIDALLGAACSDDPIFSIAATQGLMDLLDSDAAARRLADSGLDLTDPVQVRRVANALRFIGGTSAIDYLCTIKGEREEYAERLLEEVGTRPAVDALLQRRLDTLKEARDRVSDFDKEGLQIFQDTVEEAKKGFTMSLWMSGTIFVIGVMLLVVSIYLVALPDASRFQLLYGVGGGLVGLGTVLTMFYRGPLERIEKAVANLVQTEIAFLAFIRQVTQINAMFEREYVDSEKFGIAELQTLLHYTERTMKETMPLVSRYTLSRQDEQSNDRDQPASAG